MTPPIVAELHPPRLPAAFIATGWPDLLAAFGLGLLLAAVACLLVAPLLKPRPRRAEHRRPARPAASLPPAERLLAPAPPPRRDRHPAARRISGPRSTAGTPPDPAALDALIRARRRHA